jgi:hypothetical protein
MTQSRLRRSWIAGLITVTIALLAPGIAQAEPPSNDDFDNATDITALPFRTIENTAEATGAPDDPLLCQSFGTNTVWFRYTAPADAVLEVTAITSEYFPVVAAYTGTRGNLRPVPGVCAFGTNNSEAFHVTAGTTYYLLVRSLSGSGGALTLKLDNVGPAPNDNFASAQPVTGLPATFTGDQARASFEPGEPIASCSDTAVQSLWYTYTPPTSRSVSAVAVGNTSPAVTVYRGTSLTSLSEMDCVVGRVAVFTANAGETYYIRVANNPDAADEVELHVENAPPLRPFASISPNPVSVFDDVEFTPFPGDQAQRLLVGGEVRFGDGTSAPYVGGGSVRHRYAADGVYQVEVTATTDDGRTGTGTQTLNVATHDVTITAFLVPAKARPDQTKSITVTVANTRYDETVEVELLKKNGDFYTHIGTLRQFVPARADRTVTFPFAYTFSVTDATTGSVTFKAVATLPFPSPQDAHPVDNEKLATTTVR